MIIGALNEQPKDTRVAITPNSAKQLKELGFEVVIEHEAGARSGFPDEAYKEAGVQILKTPAALLKKINILLCVQAPTAAKIKSLAKDSMLIAPIDNDPKDPLIKHALKESLTLISMNLIPRISRAQNLDSLSSQASLAGYRAVIEATAHFARALPMMMTAAGVIHPAKVLILGAGVAGLQAIATAKRLGAVVYAFDVRKAAKEQVESLSAEFIEVQIDESSEDQSGYAKETSKEYQKQQQELIDEYAKKSDIIVSTALIPNRKAPVLISKKTVESMKAGSVIIDMATSRGGNCALSKEDEIIQHKGITIVGYSNLAQFVPTSASTMYANNLSNLLKLIIKDKQITLNKDDEIVQHTVITHQHSYQPFLVKKEPSDA